MGPHSLPFPFPSPWTPRLPSLDPHPHFSPLMWGFAHSRHLQQVKGDACQGCFSLELLTKPLIMDRYNSSSIIHVLFCSTWMCHNSVDRNFRVPSVYSTRVSYLLSESSISQPKPLRMCNTQIMLKNYIEKYSM